MITVASLHVYPVKSCRGLDVESAEIGATGLRHDRQWMVVDADGVFMSQRRHPGLARVGTRIEADRLILDATGLATLEVALDLTGGPPRSVTVWDDRCRAVSEGAAAADWFSTHLGTPCELVRLPVDSVRPVNRRFAEPDDRVAFADGFPFLLVSRASVVELNDRLAEPVPENRFRANIVVDGCPAHAEDGWSRLEIGGVDFQVAKPCARCVVVTTDQRTGVRSDEPLRTLAGYRTVDGKVLFGQNLIHRGGGTLHVGDAVHILHRR
jgi:uncharacterized protein YcbX